MENNISVRGKTFTGTVVSAKMHRTVVVEWERRVLIPKFERYEKRKSTVKAHNPDAIDAEEGDIVKIQETRPLSKTKHFIVLEIVEKKQNEA
ncbi:MAG: 30S ribosomal protein S17 [Candidatus Nanoarchaeia archaeon]